MKRSAVCLVVFLILTGAQSGCRGPYAPVSPSGGGPAVQQREGITMLSKDVRDVFLFRNCSAYRLPGGQIQVRVTLQNRLPKDDVWAEVQHVFYDDQGQPIEKSEWQTVHFPQWDLVMVNGNSLRTDTKSFNVQFRNLKTATGKIPWSPGFIFEWGVWFNSILPK